MSAQPSTTSQRVVRCFTKCLEPPTTRKGVNKWLCLGVTAFIVGLILVIVAGTVPGAITNLVDEGLIDAVIIDGPEAMGTDGFKFNGKAPTKMDVYVMDIMNPEEILNEGAKPVVIERGPFVYWGYKERYNLTWSSDGEILTWREWEYYIFDEKLSAESDTGRLITSLYIPFVAMRAGLTKPDAGPLAKNYLLLIFEGVKYMTPREKYFTSKTARELLWGYTDPVMELAHNIDENIDPYFPGFLVNSSSKLVQETRKSTSNQFTMWTGKNHHDKMRQFISWKNMTHVSICSKAPCPPNAFIDAWADHDSGLIRGSDGSASPPPVTRDHTLPVFFGNYFRTIDLIFQKEVVHKEVNLLRFVIPPEASMNATLNPANAVYFQSTYNGAYNVSSLASSSPILLTKVHYRDTDPRLPDNVDVVWRPQPDDVYDTFFDIEPISGAGFFARTSSMLNIQVGPLRGMPTMENETADDTWFPNLRNCHIPIFWATQEAGIPDADAKNFVSQVYGALFLSDIALYMGSIFGTVLLVISLYLLCCGFRQRGEVSGESSTLLPGQVVPSATTD